MPINKEYFNKDLTVCHVCGKKIIVYLKRANRQVYNYCSLACYRKQQSVRNLYTVTSKSDGSVLIENATSALCAEAMHLKIGSFYRYKEKDLSSKWKITKTKG